jgi:hypothetical protein
MAMQFDMAAAQKKAPPATLKGAARTRLQPSDVLRPLPQRNTVPPLVCFFGRGCFGLGSTISTHGRAGRKSAWHDG